MTEEKVLAQVNEILIDVLGNQSIRLTKATQVTEVPGWDSLNFMTVIVAIEKQFKIRFTSNQVMSWKNVSELCATIVELLRKTHGF